MKQNVFLVEAQSGQNASEAKNSSKMIEYKQYTRDHSEGTQLLGMTVTSFIMAFYLIGR